MQGGVNAVTMRASRSTSSFLAIVVAAATVLYCSSVPAASAQQAPASAPGPLCDTTFNFPNGTQKTYTQCQNLAVQNATLAWNYFPGDNVTGGILDLAFTDTLLNPRGWVGWGLTPAAGEMVGASALVAFSDSSTGGSIVLPYKLNNDLTASSPPPLVSGPTDLNVLDSSVDIDASTLATTIYATLQLQPGATNLNQIWNKGPSVDGKSPNAHDQTDGSVYMTSVGSLDVVTGTVIAGGGTSNLQNIHGILNAISWGVLFPVGIMAARYMRPFALFDPLWMYVHIACQVCGYILGVAGFATGLKILDPTDIKYKHRNLGIALFVFATVQVTALLLRPSPKHKLRKYFNVYHHSFGYTIIILSIINIFEGFRLLQPAKGWKRAYIGVIVALGAFALILEVFTWAVWVRRKLKAKRSSTVPTNGSSGKSLEEGALTPNSK